MASVRPYRHPLTSAGAATLSIGDTLNGLRGDARVVGVRSGFEHMSVDAEMLDNGDPFTITLSTGDISAWWSYR